MKTDTLLEQLEVEISTAQRRGQMTPDIMFLIKAHDEIVRLEAALQQASDDIEQLYKWINETRGQPVAIVREVRGSKE